MMRFIEEHRDVFGVGPICKVLRVAPSTYYARAALKRDPDPASGHAKQDVIDRERIKEAFDHSGRRYGACKVWCQPGREGHDIARCTGSDA